MKLLITGFDPFGGETINPAWEAVKLLDDSICDIEVVKLQIPTIFKESTKVLVEGIERHSPDFVICVGQAGGRYDISVERVGINIDDARIADNAGNQPIDEIIYSDGKSAYFSNLPIKAMVKEAKEVGVPSSVSNTAGTFVCNHILYSLLYNIEGKDIKGGFIHVPFIPNQVVDKKNTPSMSLESIAKGLTAAIGALAKYDKDINAIGGTEF